MRQQTFLLKMNLQTIKNYEQMLVLGKNLHHICEGVSVFIGGPSFIRENSVIVLECTMWCTFATEVNDLFNKSN